MKLKKILSLCLCFLMLMGTILAKASIPGSEIPYTINMSALQGTHFKVESLRDMYRLLDMAYTLKKTSFGLVVEDPVFRAEVKEALLAYIAENPDRITDHRQNGVDEYEESNLLWATIFWADADWQNPYGMLPKISCAQDLYTAYVECMQYPYYDKAFLLDPAYISYSEYYQNKLQPIYDEIKNTWDVDVSPCVSDHKYILEYGTYYVFVGITNPGKKDMEEMRRQERYERILKNNLIYPIDETTTEADKLKVLAYSVSNVVNKYSITDLPTFNIGTIEKAYSVGTGQCHHYAFFFQELCRLYDVPCYYVSGTRSGGDHAWNMVMYQGNWYLTDVNGNQVRPYPRTPDQLSLHLNNEELFVAREYFWDKDKYPRCTAESIILEGEFTYTPPMTDTTVKISMFEPYRAKNPMTIGPMIHYDIWFDKAEGKILAIDTNLGSDCFEKVDGNWQTKETTLTIPSELDGVKVKTIGTMITANHSLGTFDHMYIPDGLVLEDYAFDVNAYTTIVEHLHLGDNLTLGIDALPFARKVTWGENILYKGEADSIGYDEDTPYVTGTTFPSVTFYYSEEEKLSVPQGYSHALYGCGLNIVDETPTKTLFITEEVLYVDPRLNRLNRRFEVDQNNPNYSSLDGVLYNKDMTELISVPIGIETLKIPDTVTKIGDYALYYNNALTDLVFPQGVTAFGKDAFVHLSNLKRVIFHGRVPESFQPRLCCDFETITLTEHTAALLNFEVKDTHLFIQNTDLPAEPMAVFYDINGHLLEIKKGYSSIEIPTFAASFELYVWDDHMKPYTLKESGTL